jgi:chromosome segregation ATPase
VLDRYNLAQKELPGLEERKNSLEMGILELDRDTIAKKERVRVEVSDFRSSLEEQLVGLQKELVETRERVVATNGALREAEAGRKTRIEQLNDEVRALENRRDMAKVEIDKIQQSLRVSA